MTPYYEDNYQMSAYLASRGWPVSDPVWTGKTWEFPFEDSKELQDARSDYWASEYKRGCDVYANVISKKLRKARS